MDEVFRKINDLAIQSGRALQSPETGLVHYFYQKVEGPYQAVPLYENLLFALALCRVKSVESVQEAKVILDKLLAYQLPSGLFPIYLHDFPMAYDKYIGAELLPPLYWLHHYFHLPLGKEMAEKLSTATRRLAESSLADAEKAPFPKKVKLSGALKAIGFHLDAFPSIPSQIADCLTGAFLADPEHAKALMEKALSYWHPDLQCYMGPFEKMRFTKGKQELTLFDLYMSAYTHELSPRLHGTHPLFLQGALLFPSHWECKKQESSQKWSSSFTQNGEYPFVFQWGTSSDISLLALSAPRAKQIAFDGKTFCIELGPPPNFELKEEGKEAIFYVSLGMKILVNGLPATTFRAGDMITLEDDRIRFELRFQADEGVFQGHLSRGCLPTELHHSGSNRFNAYQWQLSWRTIDRKEGCKINVHLDYAVKD